MTIGKLNRKNNGGRPKKVNTSGLVVAQTIKNYALQYPEVSKVIKWDELEKFIEEKENIIKKGKNNGKC